MVLGPDNTLILRCHLLLKVFVELKHFDDILIEYILRIKELLLVRRTLRRFKVFPSRHHVIIR